MVARASRASGGSFAERSASRGGGRLSTPSEAGGLGGFAGKRRRGAKGRPRGTASRAGGGGREAGLGGRGGGGGKGGGGATAGGAGGVEREAMSRTVASWPSEASRRRAAQAASLALPGLPSAGTRSPAVA